jgi:hypothetical protein
MDKINKFSKMLLGEVPLGKEQMYYDFSLIPSLEDYNRADTVNMNEDEMNTFRHLAGSKQSLNDLGLPRGLGALLYKEVKDLKGGAGLQDTIYDLKNDARALKMYFNNPSLEGEQLNDFVFNNYIKPKRNPQARF